MAPETAPRVTAIILNYSRLADTLACLESLAANAYPRLDVMVLDYASSPASSGAIRSACLAAQLVPLVENRGYAGNNNVGIHMALEQGAEWVLVLNDDTILAPGCVAALVDAACSGGHVGIVGPLVYHASEPAVIQSAGMGFDSYWRSFHHGQNEEDRGQFRQRREVAAISGCAILLNATLLREVGAFDEEFFFYYEETELCFRAGRAGWKILIEPEARVWHAGVQRDYHPNANVSYYKTRNHLMMLARHHAPPRVWLHEWWDNLRTVASWTIKPKWRGQRDHRDALIQGMLDFLRHRGGQRPASSQK